MSRAKVIKRAGKIAGYSRFGMLPEEVELIDRAALIEERSRADFCRISSIQRARLIVSQYDQTQVLPQIVRAMQQENDKVQELPFKE